MKRHFKITAILFIFIIVFAFSKQFKLNKILTFENLYANKMLLMSYVKSHYIQSVLIYMASYILIISLAIPGGGVMTFSGGALFGILPAMLYVNIAATLGASFSFIITRKFFGIFVHEKFGGKLKKFNSDIKRYGKTYLLTMRLIPIFPFFFINVAAGLTNIPLTTFIWTTSLGTIPGTFAYVFAGHNIGNVEHSSQILSPPVIAALVIFGIVTIGPTLIKKHNEKIENMENQNK